MLAKRASSGVIDMGESPLEYWGRHPQRLGIIDPSASIETSQTYFKSEGYDETLPGQSNKPRDKRKKVRREGCPERMVAFIDYWGSGNRIEIAYASVRRDFEGRGLARKLIQGLYDHFPSAVIDWGELMEPQMKTLYDKFKEEYPERTGSAKIGFR